MKRIIAIIAALALSLSLASCGSNNQANAIKAACDLARAKDFEGVSAAFGKIAANDSGYLMAARGARTWARYEGDPNGKNWNYSPSEDSFRNIDSFYAICDLP